MSHPSGPDFRHDALLYRGLDGFVDAVSAFVRGGLEADEPVLVAAPGDRLDALQADLGRDAARVEWRDLAAVGRNPSRIIPLWREFVDAADGPVRGVGEPVWRGRTPAEITECQRHEHLLNLAFGAGSPWWLVCPYDADALPGDVVAAAGESHPEIVGEEGRVPSRAYDPHAPYAALDGSLPPPPAPPRPVRFGAGGLDAVRDAVLGRAVVAGLGDDAGEDLALAVHEIATNSVVHGGGGGELLMWAEEGRLVCEVRDRGRIRNPLVGRVAAAPDRLGGRGVWLANALCDLVQIRSTAEGTAVRVHQRVG